MSFFFRRLTLRQMLLQRGVLTERFRSKDITLTSAQQARSARAAGTMPPRGATDAQQAIASRNVFLRPESIGLWGLSLNTLH